MEQSNSLFKFKIPKLVSHHILLILFSVTAAVCSWSAHAVLNLNPVWSALSVVTVAYFLSPERSLVSYGAAFICYSPTDMIPGPQWAALLGVFVYLFYSLFEVTKIFPGIGGKIGTQCILSIGLLTLLLNWTTPDYFVTFWKPERYQTINHILGPSAYVLVLCGALSCVFLRKNVEQTKNPIPASLVVVSIGVFALMFVPYGDVETMMHFLLVGTFLGMSSFTRIPDYKTVVLCSILAASFGLATLGFTSGEEGGKAGFDSLCSLSIYLFILVPLYKRISQGCSWLASSFSARVPLVLFFQRAESSPPVMQDNFGKSCLPLFEPGAAIQRLGIQPPAPSLAESTTSNPPTAAGPILPLWVATRQEEVELAEMLS